MAAEGLKYDTRRCLNLQRISSVECSAYARMDEWADTGFLRIFYLYYGKHQNIKSV